MWFKGGGTGGGESMDFAALHQVRAYWEAMRDGDRLPRRDALDPRGMGSALENVFLIEQVAPNHGRIRLAGMHLSDLLGMEVRGMPVTALMEPVARSRLSEALGGLFRGEAILDLALEAERGIGRPALAARMLLLPVTGSTAEPSLALGCLCSVGDIGRTPRRFAISRMLREELRVGAPQPAFAEAEAAYHPPPPRGRPSLRLVSSRD